MFKRLVLVLIATLVLASLSPALTGAAPGSSDNPITNPDNRIDLNAPMVPGQFIVKFKDNTSKLDHTNSIEARGGRVFNRISGSGAEVIDFAGSTGRFSRTQTEALIRELKSNPNVEYIEPNYIYKTQFTPNDPSLGSQWAWGVIKAFQAWDVTQGSASTVIAVVDTGVMDTHADLDAKIVPGFDFVQNDSTPQDGNGHGSHVSGTSAAETNNATGGAGTCPNCKVMGVRVLDNSGSGTLANVANGIRYAADNGAKVVNLSLGGSGSATLQSAVDYAWGRGVFLACAAGNDGTSSTTNAFPAAYANCYAIASTNSSDAKSSFSNFGTWVEVAAPGEGIFSTWNNGSYNTISGTSMATPHVAGLAGLLASQGLTNAQIRDRICNTADRISGTGSQWTCGRINAFAAVSGTTGPTPTTGPSPIPTNTPIPSACPTNGGFESGTSPWVQASSGGFQLITTDNPHAGAFSVWMGGYNNATESIYQTCTIPAGKTLRFWRYMTSSEGTTTAFDFLRVRIHSTSGTLLATLYTLSNTGSRNTWVQESVSLASFAGQTVRITFATTTDSSLTSSFFVDDVTLQ